MLFFGISLQVNFNRLGNILQNVVLCLFGLSLVSSSSRRLSVGYLLCRILSNLRNVLSQLYVYM